MVYITEEGLHDSVEGGNVMLTKLHKEELIRKAFDVMYDKGDIKKVRKEIFATFLQDTEDGKLYKYRAVSKYSLHNLRTGTLYCAKPSAFNDPFDCKPGINMSYTVLGWVLQGVSEMGEFLIKFVQVYEGNWPIDILEQREQEVYKRWMRNRKICSFIEKGLKGEGVEDDYHVVLENMDAFVEMMKEFTSDIRIRACLDDFIQELPTLKEEIEQMSDEQRKSVIKENVSVGDLAKVYGVNSVGDEIAIMGEIEAMRKQDAGGWSSKIEEGFDTVYKTVIRRIDEMFRIGCLCDDYKNCLMWSHYADCHKGFCIEYDFNSWFEENQEIWILPIAYSGERVKIPGSAFMASGGRDRESEYELFRSLLTKDGVWSYEGEWRIITPSAVDTVKMPKITCIYIGVGCDEIDKAFILDIAKEKDIPVKHMVMDRGEYRVYAKEMIC